MAYATTIHLRFLLVPRYDECRYTYHERLSLTDRSLKIIVQRPPISLDGSM
jgi:hypothetical protein